MHRFFIISIILLSLLGCERNKPGKELIPPETLVPVLVDIHLLYSIQSSNEYRELSRKVDSIDTHNYIFEKHHTSQAQFDSTIAWYSRQPELFTDIYDQVVMQLTRISDSLNQYWD
jgi:hypothetical protein